MGHCIVALGLSVMEQMYYYLFYFIEIIFEFSIEYRVYDSVILVLSYFLVLGLR